MVELAQIGLMALRHAGNLKMPDPPGRQVLANFHGHIALDDLAMVEVHLHLEVVRPHGLHDAMGLVLPVEEKAGDIAGVDGLDEHIPTGRLGLGACPGQVLQVGGLMLRTGFALRQQTGHDMDAGAIEGLGVFQRERKTRTKFGFAPRNAGAAPTPRGPSGLDARGIGAARRGIEEHLLQAPVLQSGLNLGSVESVRKQVLDRFKAVLGRGLKTIEERHFAVHHGEVGGKSGHGGVPWFTSGPRSAPAMIESGFRPAAWPRVGGARVARFLPTPRARPWPGRGLRARRWGPSG